jgi:hypothetical protein
MITRPNLTRGINLGKHENLGRMVMRRRYTRQIFLLPLQTEILKTVILGYVCPWPGKSHDRLGFVILFGSQITKRCVSLWVSIIVGL